MERALETESLRTRRGSSDHSYKFQRLREKIRQAVASGELSGKLPGERELARRFQVNAKTLSKALTDLAAEGLLSRSIGRGTFVKGSEVQTTTQGPWLLLCDAEQAASPVVDALRKLNPELKTITDAASARPSFLNQFAAVVDLAAQTPDAFLRDLLVRNVPLVVVGREPSTYATSAVIFDRPYLASRLARDLLLAGHQRLAVVESDAQQTGGGESPLCRTMLAAAARYSPEAKVKSCLSQEVLQLAENGTTAFVCASVSAARQTLDSLSAASISVPASVSVSAVAEAAGNDVPCTGFFLSPEQEAEAIAYLLQNGQVGGGGNVLWLTGQYVDRATTGVAPAAIERSVLTLTA
jgi:DNA-binding transcriptional regulator YhcF (GntR family)